MANVTIITPPQLYTLTQIASVAVPPIGAAYIAGHLRGEGHEVTFVDAFGEAMNQFTTRGDHHLRGLRFDEILARIPSKTELIGISNMFSHAWPVVRELAREIKQQFQDIPIVSGGVHPTVLYELVLADGAIDYCVLGEGETTMAALARRLPAGESVDDLDGLAFIHAGQVRVREKTELITDLDRLPLPAYDMLPIEHYITAKSPHGAARGRWLPLIATRGCPYRCTFCTAEEMWLPKFRKRTPANVVEEIAFWNERLAITDFHFEDLTMVLDKVWTLTFANELKRRDLKITWQMPNGTRSEPVDDEMIEHLKASGCTNITFAPESGSPTTLAKVKKELDLDTLVAACRRAVKSGMSVCCFFVVGFPHETKREIRETLRFVRRLARVGVHEISITAFTALPGSALFRTLLAEGKIELNDRFFRDLLYMSDLSWAPSWIEGMTDQQIASIRRLGYVQFFATSYLFHPTRLVRTIGNILRGVEENKLERVGYEKLRSGGKLIRKFFGHEPVQPTAGPSTAA